MQLQKKIVLFAPCIYCGGGTERVLVNLANELATHWKIIVVVNSSGNKNLYQLDSSIQVKQYAFGYLRNKYPHNLLIKIVNKLFGILILRGFFQNHIFKQTNLIISFSPSITSDCFRTTFRDKLISFEHWPFSAYSKYPKIQRTIRKVFPSLKKIIVLTEHERKVYEDFGCNVAMIANVYSFFPAEPAKLKNKIVLSIGHFNEQKRRDLLISSWFLVDKVHHDWKLHIIGDGPLKQQAVNQIVKLGLQDTITIIDPTSDILTHYLTSSIFVLSSEFEALPLVLIEAKAVGLPCVSFDIVSGPIEIINDQKDGFVVDFPNVKEMANKINLLIEDENLRVEFGKIGREDAVGRYNPKTIYEMWFALLEKIVD